MELAILTCNTLFAGRDGANDARAQAIFIREPLRALVAGDLNSASPHDPEPEGFDTLSAHHRACYLADDLQGADRSVLARLEAAGWVDLGHRLDPAKVATVPTADFTGTEFAMMRCDYLLASASFAQAVRHYEVICRPVTDGASDHYPVLARFELLQ